MQCDKRARVVGPNSSLPAHGRMAPQGYRWCMVSFGKAKKGEAPKRKKEEPLKINLFN